MKPIAHIETSFPTKFGLPRQGGLVEELKGRIVFEKEYRRIEAFKGLEDFSHIWVIWEFSESKCDKWHPTVRPPRLGGNKRMGVFATRSPFRPNPIGLSCVRLDGIVLDEKAGPTLLVSGIDMMDGTPIYDIKPYLNYADCYPDAKSGFGDTKKEHKLKIRYEEKMMEGITEETRSAMIGFLEQDPVPQYIDDAKHIFKIKFAELDIHFTIENDSELTITEIIKP